MQGVEVVRGREGHRVDVVPGEHVPDILEDGHLAVRLADPRLEPRRAALQDPRVHVAEGDDLDPVEPENP